METKEELIGNVKEWVKTDNEIIKMKKDIKALTQKKKEQARINVCWQQHPDPLVEQTAWLRDTTNAPNVSCHGDEYVVDTESLVRLKIGWR